MKTNKVSIIFILFSILIIIPIFALEHSHPTIIIWDNHGTITGSKNPTDTARIILPNIEKIMRQKNTINIVCSGTKSEHELQNFDPNTIIEELTTLMNKLPIQLAIFSPAAGGTECWVIIKNKTGAIEISKAHENTRYTNYRGKFKKPDTGMLIVIKDILKEIFGYTIDATNAIFIGDALQDKQAATNFGIPFMFAQEIHQLSDNAQIELMQLSVRS